MDFVNIVVLIIIAIELFVLSGGNTSFRKRKVPFEAVHACAEAGAGARPGARTNRPARTKPSARTVEPPK